MAGREGTLSAQVDRIKTILQTKSVLGSLSDNELADLAQRARATSFVKGAVIYRRGDEADHMMVILAGRVKISNVTDDAREVVLNFLGEGDLTGELAALDGNPRSADATALENTEVAILYRRDFIPVLERNPAALLEIIRLLSEKLRMTSNMVEHSQLQMSGKAAHGLLRLASTHGRRTAEGILLDLKLSQRDLGGYLGLSRENTSRELGRLRDQGLIKIDGSRIVIVDADQLQGWAEQKA